MELTKKHLAFLRKIEKTNADFEAASPEQKRVMIAKDVIERIKLNMFQVKRGVLCQIEEKGKHVVNKENLNNTYCRVCAKGGLFVAFVGRANNFEYKFSDYILDPGFSNAEDNKPHKKLNELFSMKQLSLIEFVFEGTQYIKRDVNYDPIEFDEAEQIKIHEYRKKFGRVEVDGEFEYDYDKLLTNICQNIIKNNGEFVL